MKATPVRDEDGTVRLAINVIEDITELKRAEQGQRFLAEAGRVLAGSLDYEETLRRRRAARGARHRRLVRASTCSPTASSQRVAVAHVDPEKVEMAPELARRYPTDPTRRAGVADVLRTGRPRSTRDITDEMLVAARPRRGAPGAAALARHDAR